MRTQTLILALALCGAVALAAPVSSADTPAAGKSLHESAVPAPFAKPVGRRLGWVNDRISRWRNSAENSGKRAAEKTSKAAESGSKAAERTGKAAAEKTSKAAENSSKAAERSGKAAAERTSKTAERSSKAEKNGKAALENAGKAAAEKTSKAAESSSKAAAERAGKLAAAERSTKDAVEKSTKDAVEKAAKTAAEKKDKLEKTGKAAAEKTQKAAAKEKADKVAFENAAKAAAEKTTKAAESNTKAVAERAGKERATKEDALEKAAKTVEKSGKAAEKKLKEAALEKKHKAKCVCSNGTGATGLNCPSNGASKCTSCNSAFFLRGTECEAHRKCGPGQGRDASTNTCSACGPNKFSSSLSTAACEDHISCTGTQYELTPLADAFRQRKCADHNPCDAVKAWQIAGPTETADYQCGTCTNWSYQYIKQDSSAPGGHKCQTITFCGNSGFIAPGDEHSYRKNRRCTPYSTCAAGQFETVPKSPTSDRKCGICPAGTYSDIENASICLPCDHESTETYQPDDGMTQCISMERCPKGKFRTGFSDTTQGTCSACLPGHFKTSKGSSAFDTCTRCHPGHYSTSSEPATLETCARCDKGHYQSSRGKTTCDACPEGRYTEHFGRTSVNFCDHCPAGKFAASKGQPTCDNCKAGKRGEVSRAVTDDNHCVHCTKGQYQTADGMPHCESCAPGQFAPNDGHSTGCLSCLENYVTAGGEQIAGKIDEYTYYWTNNLAGAHRCVKHPRDCVARPWSDPTTTSTKCNRQCNGGTRVETRYPLRQEWGGGLKCSQLTWKRTLDCNDQACPQDCRWQDWGDWDTCTHRCGPNGRQTRTRTTETTVEMLFDHIQCDENMRVGSKCKEILTQPAGKSFAHGGKPCVGLDGKAVSQSTTSEASVRKCSRRVEGEAGETYPCEVDCDIGVWGAWEECSATCSTGARPTKWRTRVLVEPKWGGKKCTLDGTTGSAPLPTRNQGFCSQQCCKGYFEPNTGSATASQPCRQCDKGKVAAGERSTSCTPCQHGEYNDNVAQDKCKHCPKGTQNDRTGSKTIEDCADCEKGKFANNHRSKHCSMCAKGKFNALMASDSADACMNCDLGQFAAAEGSHKCELCPIGQYNDVDKFSPSATCKECPAGHFTPNTGRKSELDCQHCTCGMWSQKGSNVCATCPAGRYRTCPAGSPDNLFADGKPECAGGVSAMACAIAQPGYMAPEGSCTPTQCGVGEYQDQPGKSACLKCPAGTASDTLGATTIEVCRSCGKGEWSYEGASKCEECAPGSSSSDTNRTEPCTWCEKGTYAAVEGSSTCTSCEPGRWIAASSSNRPNTACHLCSVGTANSNTKSSSITSCKDCDAGEYQPAEGKPSCTRCEVGKYQEREGMTQCDECVAGSANGLEGSKHASACKLCAKGYYTPVRPRASGSSDARGHKSCTACGLGKHANSKGGRSEAACTWCASGSYSDEMGLALCKNCLAGTFGDEGRSQDRHATKSAGADSSAHCVECPGGEYQEHDGATDCVTCAADHYTPPNDPKHPHYHPHDHVGCIKCEVIDSVRRYSTFGKAGQNHCEPVPLDCKPSPWGAVAGLTNSYGWSEQANNEALADGAGSAHAKHQALEDGAHARSDFDQGLKFDNGPLHSQWTVGDWSQCSKSCTEQGGKPGKQTRTRHPVRQPANGACGNGGSTRYSNGFRGTNGKGARDLSEDDCKQAWGGGKPCSDFQWEEWRECGTQPCPIDCVMSQWGEWEPCSKTCGKGETYRVRVIETHPAFGGVECPTEPEHTDVDTAQHGYSTTDGCHSPPCKTWVRDSKPCNDHSCGKHCSGGKCHSYPATCNLEHVHCTVKWLTHHRSNKQIRQDLVTCGHSAIEESNPCWNNLDGLGNTCKRDGTYQCKDGFASHSNNDFCNEDACHKMEADELALSARLEEQYKKCVAGDAGLKIQNANRASQGLPPIPGTSPCKKKWPTLQVTHDRKNMDHAGQFHCKRDGPSSCSCQCDRHPTCCDRKNNVLVSKELDKNTAMRGNRFFGVEAKQDCCNMCTNHPTCTSWEYTSEKVCVLQDGLVTEASFAPNPVPNDITTWAGTPAGTPCTFVQPAAAN